MNVSWVVTVIFSIYMTKRQKKVVEPTKPKF